jgi:hypothetical protein
MSTEKYPRSSIEDDFNYGTNVATASVQIRMGEKHDADHSNVSDDDEGCYSSNHFLFPSSSRLPP